MDIHPKIEQILKEYHIFCLSLIDKIQADSFYKEQLLEQVYKNYQMLREGFTSQQTIAEYLENHRISNDRTGQ